MKNEVTDMPQSQDRPLTKKDIITVKEHFALIVAKTSRYINFIKVQSAKRLLKQKMREYFEKLPFDAEVFGIGVEDDLDKLIDECFQIPDEGNEERGSVTDVPNLTSVSPRRGKSRDTKR